MHVLELTINGVPWFETEDLASSSPDDLHYVVDPDSGRISFGDGKHGAVPAAGAKFGLRLTDNGTYELNVPHGGEVTITTVFEAADKSSSRRQRAGLLGCLTLIVGAVAGLFARRSRR